MNGRRTSAMELNWISALSSGDLEHFKRHIDYLNGDVNHKTTAYECSFLHWACDARSPAAIQFLIESNADLNACDIYGNTPMHNACLNSFTKGLELLINAGARMDVKNSDGNTPLGVACYTSFAEGLELLLMSGAAVEKIEDINMRHRRVKPEIVDLLMSFNGGKATKAASNKNNKHSIDLYLEN